MRFYLLRNAVQDRNHVKHQLIGGPPDFRIVPAFIYDVEEALDHYHVSIDPLEFIPNLFGLHFNHPGNPQSITIAPYVIIKS